MVQSDDISLSVDVQRRVKEWEEVSRLVNFSLVFGSMVIFRLPMCCGFDGGD